MPDPRLLDAIGDALDNTVGRVLKTIFASLMLLALVCGVYLACQTVHEHNEQMRLENARLAREPQQLLHRK